MISSYRRLLEIEKSFRMSKSDLQARPIYHHKRESIEAHLTIVFAALAVCRFIEARTGWSIRKFVRTARRYRTIEIQFGPRTIATLVPSSPATSARHSTPSARRPEVRTNLSQVRPSVAPHTANVARIGGQLASGHNLARHWTTL